ncbi:MAG: mechanosensitive ion channel family protein [Candidatus Poribacteria bacterium]|nr:mechanosensitive ion channel family protein [Candidatus Poribacteria bacterium]
MFLEFMQRIEDLITTVINSPFRGILLSIATIAILLILKAILGRFVRAYVYKNAQLEENAKNFMAVWGYVWTAIIIILGIIGLSGSFKTLGISAGFLGMILGWSLQAPVTGIAAWLMLILKRPFKIGDRVIIAGITGDVMDITLTHVILNQVGGTISSEERSGRGILIPNAILFAQTITNYTLEEEYILVEVPVRITFESNWEEAERILVDAAKVVTADVIQEIGEDPFIRAELFDAGVMMRLRYKTRPTNRAKSLSDIVKIIFHEFAKNDTVEFCYAHTEVIYSWKDQTTLPGALRED